AAPDKTRQEAPQPTLLVSSRDGPETRKPLEDAGEDQHDQGALHFMAEDRRADVTIQRLLDRQAAFRAHARDAVQADRHVELLGFGPEGIVVGRAVWSVLGRGSPDQGALQASIGAAAELLHRVA